MIVHKIDKHQKVFDMTLGAIRVINSATTDKVQPVKRSDVKQHRSPHE